MFAILETGGKQYKVTEGDVIEVERIEGADASKQNRVSFSEVLLIQDKDLHLGQPYVENGRIEAKVLEELKAPKVIVFKKKAKKGYKRTRGHRQVLYRLQIEKITLGKAVRPEAKGGDAPASKTADVAPAPAKKTPKPKASAAKPSAAKTRSPGTATKKAAPARKTAAAGAEKKKSPATRTAAGKKPSTPQKKTGGKEKEK